MVRSGDDTHFFHSIPPFDRCERRSVEHIVSDAELRLVPSVDEERRSCNALCGIDEARSVFEPLQEHVRIADAHTDHTQILRLFIYL